MHTVVLRFANFSATTIFTNCAMPPLWWRGDLHEVENRMCSSSTIYDTCDSLTMNAGNSLGRRHIVLRLPWRNLMTSKKITSESSNIRNVEAIFPLFKRGKLRNIPESDSNSALQVEVEFPTFEVPRGVSVACNAHSTSVIPIASC